MSTTTGTTIGGSTTDNTTDNTTGTTTDTTTVPTTGTTTTRQLDAVGASLLSFFSSSVNTGKGSTSTSFNSSVDHTTANIPTTTVSIWSTPSTPKWKLQWVLKDEHAKPISFGCEVVDKINLVSEAAASSACADGHPHPHSHPHPHPHVHMVCLDVKLVCPLVSMVEIESIKNSPAPTNDVLLLRNHIIKIRGITLLEKTVTRNKLSSLFNVWRESKHMPADIHLSYGVNPPRIIVTVMTDRLDIPDVLSSFYAFAMLPKEFLSQVPIQQIAIEAYSRVVAYAE